MLGFPLTTEFDQSASHFIKRPYLAHQIELPEMIWINKILIYFGREWGKWVLPHGLIWFGVNQSISYRLLHFSAVSFNITVIRMQGWKNNWILIISINNTDMCRNTKKSTLKSYLIFNQDFLLHHFIKWFVRNGLVNYFAIHPVRREWSLPLNVIVQTTDN